MASPFNFFRRNQRSMMVVLVILAMIVFTLESVFSSRDSHFVILGALVGGLFLALAGIGQGKWIQYGIGGALLGALCGWILPDWISASRPGAMAINSAIGVFDEERIAKLLRNRTTADQFLYQAREEAYGKGMARFFPGFGFNHQSDREDTIFAELMRVEAGDLGIVVTDEMVTNYINEATGNKLTSKAFAAVRGGLIYEGQKINDEKLFDILREEVKAQLAYSMLQPQLNSMPPGPDVYYSTFRRLNVSQRLNTAAIEVDAFLSKVPEPSDADVNTLFTAARGPTAATLQDSQDARRRAADA